MTCIVALKVPNVCVWVGGDSGAFKEDEISQRSCEKVFYNGDFLIGFSGSFRVGQLIKYSFSPPPIKDPENIMRYFVVDFIDSLKECLRSKGNLKTNESGEECHECDIIVAYKDKVVSIESDFNVGDHLDNYISIGSGALYALGALSAIEEIDNLTPEQKILKSLFASEKHSPSVVQPFTVLRTR
jgi:ATP-dependent protease HslVU (ClpYQ) peptidase subunit